MNRTSQNKLNLLAEWQQLLDMVPGGADQLQWLATAGATTFASVDFARRTRNACAHGRSVSDTAVEQALRTVRCIRGSLNGTTPDSPVDEPIVAQGRSAHSSVLVEPGIMGYLNVRCPKCQTVTPVPESRNVMICPQCRGQMDIHTGEYEYYRLFDPDRSV